MNRPAMPSLFFALCASYTSFTGVQAMVLKVEKRKVKIACIGDSITEGQTCCDNHTEGPGHAALGTLVRTISNETTIDKTKIEEEEYYSACGEGGKPYPAILQELLGDGYDVRNYGHHSKRMRRRTAMGKKGAGSYWDTSEFLSAKAFSPDIAIIMLGTNDAPSEPMPPEYAAELEEDYTAMIEEFKQKGAKVIAVSPPADFAPGASYGAKWINNDLPKIVSRIAQKSGAKSTDCFAPFKQRCPSLDAHSCDLITDYTKFIHPCLAGCELIANTIYKAVKG